MFRMFSTSLLIVLMGAGCLLQTPQTAEIKDLDNQGERLEWRTFRNSLYGYSFSYPSNYYLFSRVDIDGQLREALDDDWFVGVAKSKELLAETETGTVEVRVHGSSKSPEQFFKDAGNYLPMKEMVSKGQIKDGPYAGIEITGSGDLSSLYKVRVLKDDENNVVVVITQSVQDPFLDQIYSSFAFIK